MLNVMRSISEDEFSNELSLMLLILREDTKTETVLQYISNIDWGKFLELVKHHRVYSLVYVNLNKIGSNLIDEEVVLELQRLYKNNTVKMLQLTRELSIVCRTLNDSGIRSILLKGPILALQLYGELSHRTSKDLDILIDINDVEEAIEVLKKLGYHPDDTDAYMYWKKKSHHISFLHSIHSTQIEIHWRLNPDIMRSPSFEELWKNRKTMVIYNQELNHLGDEDSFIYLADHGARHGWFRLRWLIDIDRIVRKQMDVSKLNSFFKLYGGRVYVEQAIQLSHLLFSSKIPLEFHSFLISRKSINITQMALEGIKNSPNMEESFASKYKRNINSVLTGRQRLNLLHKRLLPSSLDAEILPLPKTFSFLYIPLRPFLWFWRLMRRT